jgi:hypothetical protein
MRQAADTAADTASAVRLVRVSYDAGRGAFEGRVDVERDGRTFRYPCSVAAPETADRAWVEGALAQAALRQSDSGRSDSRLH